MQPAGSADKAQNFHTPSREKVQGETMATKKKATKKAAKKKK
jgi:hypothetical protein